MPFQRKTILEGMESEARTTIPSIDQVTAGAIPGEAFPTRGIPKAPLHPDSKQKEGTHMQRLLDNYRQLVARVDNLCAGITRSLGERITCSEGCSGCCAAITIFPVEAAALKEALQALPPEEADEIRAHVAEHAGGDRCPLLSRDRCLLYRARPIICRTHGLPILFTEGETRRADCCPRNLTDGGPLSGSQVIDLDRLNQLLVAVNALYLKQSGAPGQPERLTIARTLVPGDETSHRL